MCVSTDAKKRSKTPSNVYEILRQAYIYTRAVFNLENSGSYVSSSVIGGETIKSGHGTNHEAVYSRGLYTFLSSLVTHEAERGQKCSPPEHGRASVNTEL